MSASVYGKGVSGLLKRYWHEIPGVMGATIIGFVGLGIGLYAYNKALHVPRAPKYKHDYIVVRPDDPRATAPERTYPLGDYFDKK